MQSPGVLLRADTRNIAPSAQFDFWASVMRRVDLHLPAGGCAFRARVKRAAGTHAELWDHASDAVDVSRSMSRFHRDHGDELFVALVERGPVHVEQAGVRLDVPPGSLYAIDFARPVRGRWSRHREIAIVVSRGRAEQVAGAKVERATSKVIPARGLGAVLGAQLRALADTVDVLSPEQRRVAVDLCADLALHALVGGVSSEAGAARFGSVFFRRARDVIRRHCHEPAFDAERLAAHVGCSRTSLYRLFAAHGTTVARDIWDARLERAHERLVADPADPGSITEIARSCGFVDLAGFSRMFRRRYGMSPRDARVRGRD